MRRYLAHRIVPGPWCFVHRRRRAREVHRRRVPPVRGKMGRAVGGCSRPTVLRHVVLYLRRSARRPRDSQGGGRAHAFVVPKTPLEISQHPGFEAISEPHMLRGVGILVWSLVWTVSVAGIRSGVDGAYIGDSDPHCNGREVMLSLKIRDGVLETSCGRDQIFKCDTGEDLRVRRRQES